MAARLPLCLALTAFALCPVEVCAQDAGAPDGGVPDDAAQTPAVEPTEEPAEEPTEEEEEQEPPRDEAAQPAPPRLIPPRIVRSAPPAYPESRLGERLHPSVVLIVTLDPDGQVVDAEVEHSADADFDAAARAGLQLARAISRAVDA